MADKRPAMVVCCRADDPEHNGVPGSVERTCIKCQSPILVSPATIETMRQLNAAGRYVETHCLPCGAPVLTATELVEFPEIEAERAAWSKIRN